MSFHEDGKWWVSPCNYDPEVPSKLEFPEKIEILDTTLRDGEQQPSIILTKDEKFLIAANQLSDNLVIYERDLRTGLLSLTDEKPMPQKPIVLEELA